MKATARSGETLDEICWRELGRTRNVTEQAFALNPGLADLGARLPAGTEVELPAIDQASKPVRTTVKLWD